MYAILSDIHGNIAALASVLAEIDSLNIENLLVLGDNVGYYYYSSAVFERLDQYNWTGIQGNHEAMMIESAQGSDDDRKRLIKKYGSTYSLEHSTALNKSYSKYLILPETRTIHLEDKSVLLCHGTPWDRDEYIYPDSKAEVFERISTYGDVVFLGHSHYQFHKKVNNCNIINPGSVGQPRNKNSGGACYGIFDPTNMSFTLKVCSYSYESLSSECKSRDPEFPYLWRVLGRMDPKP